MDRALEGLPLPTKLKGMMGLAYRPRCTCTHNCYSEKPGPNSLAEIILNFTEFTGKRG